MVSDFRSYANLDLTVNSRLVVLTGDNGAGKTNLLEALSLFGPGRGLRRADLSEMIREGAPNGFSVSVLLDIGTDQVRLGTGADPATPDMAVTRKARIDGETVWQSCRSRASA
jgi:DNA replication and repair protein RecF